MVMTRSSSKPSEPPIGNQADRALAVPPVDSIQRRQTGARRGPDPLPAAATARHPDNVVRSHAPDRGTTVTGAQPPGAPELDNASAFVAAAGLRLTHVAGDRVEGVIDLGPAHHTPWGVVHGGVYTAAIESAASVGATTAVADRGQIAVGTNNNTDFLPLDDHRHRRRHRRTVQQGRTQQLWEVRITDQSGRVVARGTVRLQNIQPRQ